MNKDLALCVAAATLSYMLDKKNRKKKRLWSRQWLLRRREESVASRLLRELREEDPDTLRQWTRLDQQQFQDLLALVTSLIKKQDTNMRQAVSPAERLTLTLRYLANSEDDVNVFAANQLSLWRYSEILLLAPGVSPSRRIIQTASAQEGGEGCTGVAFTPYLHACTLKNDEMNDEKARQVRILLETVPLAAS
ncbi:hypothetical protein GWK47_031375 [Chionoecetes opilio]|uniref:Uncharacterized protein n=1 Tax=Chionoecetes opilio TaxID=41210 RepID=A0A8J4YIY0_CHIOP|nr:hypothetical protein GWK47_031375 [Chionoecetes opilio]